MKKEIKLKYKYKEGQIVYIVRSTIEDCNNQVCPECNGTGIVNNDVCTKCWGNLYQNIRNVRFFILKGIIKEKIKHRSKSTNIISPAYVVKVDVDSIPYLEKTLHGTLEEAIQEVKYIYNE